ncbi:unnamed protein product [Oppiella nova]|uniref:NR LBD domain-containing protein n=1 Tax=Oppiella nova TaxID=334625 RepID=A0A7R9M1P4_9ACAR|nr:unnamed protein product [Oppiella nova]CAG2168491.1 unnamed protein product [Oppiella nova]
MLSEDEKVMNKLKLKEKRIKLKQTDGKCEDIVNFTTDSSNDSSHKTVVSEVPENQNHSEDGLDFSVFEIENSYSDTNMTNILDVVCQSDPYNSSLISIPRPLTDYRNQLNELEGNKLTEILFATNQIQEPQTTTIISNINDMDEYHDDNNSFLLHLEFLRNERNNLYEAYKNYLGKMMPLVHNDPVIMHLLTAILLFNPKRPHLTHKQLVKLQQRSYIHLLQRYYLLKYRSEYEANAKFRELWDIMPDICVLSGILWRNGTEAQPTRMGPILREIFDKTL